MDIYYKCACQEGEQKVVVTDRVPGSDILAWMEEVAKPSLSYHHTAISPNCQRREMEYCRIPVAPGGGIGEKPIINQE